MYRGLHQGLLRVAVTLGAPQGQRSHSPSLPRPCSLSSMGFCRLQGPRLRIYFQPPAWKRCVYAEPPRQAPQGREKLTAPFNCPNKGTQEQAHEGEGEAFVSSCTARLGGSGPPSSPPPSSPPRLSPPLSPPRCCVSPPSTTGDPLVLERLPHHGSRIPHTALKRLFPTQVTSPQGLCWRC